MITHPCHIPPSSCQIKHILIVEDEGEMCLLLNLILNKKELRVRHVKTLSDAAAFLQKKQLEPILLDNRLPDGYGFDFAVYVKANYPAIKIIMIPWKWVLTGFLPNRLPKLHFCSRWIRS
jgi:DNA-binding NtrC family response regulator